MPTKPENNKFNDCTDPCMWCKSLEEIEAYWLARQKDTRHEPS